MRRPTPRYTGTDALTPSTALFRSGLIAKAVSGTSGSGVAGLVATAVASNGSVANINAIQGGTLESGVSQSDVAYWAYTGTGLYEGKDRKSTRLHSRH